VRKIGNAGCVEWKRSRRNTCGKTVKGGGQKGVGRRWWRVLGEDGEGEEWLRKLEEFRRERGMEGREEGEENGRGGEFRRESG